MRKITSVYTIIENLKVQVTNHEISAILPATTAKSAFMVNVNYIHQLQVQANTILISIIIWQVSQDNLVC